MKQNKGSPEPHHKTEYLTVSVKFNTVRPPYTVTVHHNLYVQILYNREFLFTNFHRCSVRVALYRGALYLCPTIFCSQDSGDLIVPTVVHTQCSYSQGDIANHWSVPSPVSVTEKPTQWPQ